MTQIKKKDGRGGKRPGAGRPRGSRTTVKHKERLSTAQITAFQEAAESKAKETGKSLQDVVLGIAYDESAPRRDQLAAAKLYWDKSMIAVHEGGEADKQSGPAIYLPEQRDNVVPIVK